MDLTILKEKLENYVGMYKEDVEEFLYDELDNNINNVLDDEEDKIIFVCSNFQITLQYSFDEVTNDCILENYEIEFI